MEQLKAINKIKDIVDRVKIAMMTTLNPHQIQIHSRPMQVMQVDNDAAMWFFTDELAGKTASLKTDNPVSLIFTSPEEQVYLSLTGRAYLIKDEELANSLWNPVLNTWFPEKQKEHLLIIKFVPDSAEYWEEKDNRWIHTSYAGKALV